MCIDKRVGAFHKVDERESWFSVMTLLPWRKESAVWVWLIGPASLVTFHVLINVYELCVCNVSFQDSTTWSWTRRHSRIRALSHGNDIIDIYSNSWGPLDEGFIVQGPGTLGKRTFKKEHRR